MKKIATLILLVFLMQQSYGCDFDEQSFLWWYFKSDLICSGKVINIYEKDSVSYNVKLSIDKVYKGENMDTLLLTVNSYPEWSTIISDCDVHMKIGDQRLIYAKKENNYYYTGGQESRSNLDSVIRKFHPQDYSWLETIDSKVTDFYWNWNEFDRGPVPNNLDSIVNKNFNIQVVDSSSIHSVMAFVLCNIDEKGNLMESNLFYHSKANEKQTSREIYGKFEYLNPETKCFTDFQRESIKITKLIKKWTPAIFCDKFVKSQVLIKYTYKNNKINVELKN
ncbi:MAG: hypothetical protein JW857_04950 [Bacteroidales bacterium]|nr:hypothetical protein [Bacteroidales bacterium]